MVQKLYCHTLPDEPAVRDYFEINQAYLLEKSWAGEGYFALLDDRLPDGALALIHEDTVYDCFSAMQ